MKIGDKVRFLNEIGGGFISGFQGKGIVLVEDADGFQIPTNITDIVLDNAEDYSTKRMVQQSDITSHESSVTEDNRSISFKLREGSEIKEELEEDEEEKEISFTPKVAERKGGNKLSFFLAFVPVEIKDLLHSRFEVYLINDCNYKIQYLLCSQDGVNSTLRYVGVADANTKIFLADVSLQELDQMQHLSVQTLFYKEDKAFIGKHPLDIQLRINPTRFCKLHSFEDNIFFTTPALIFKLIEDDKPLKEVEIDTDKLKDSFYVGSSAQSVKRESIVGRYEDNQRKGNKKHSPFYSKKKDDGTVVIDLHASEILDSTQGLSNADILQYQLKTFKEVLLQYSKKHGQKIVVIHGKGEGVLRQAIIKELRYHYKSYIYQDASFQEYGYGATLITIK